MSPSGKWQVGLLLSIIKSEYFRCKENTCLLPIVNDSGTLSSVVFWYHETHLFDGPFHIQFSCSVVSNSSWPHGKQSTSGLPVHHQLQEFTQTHLHGVSDAIQPSLPLLPTSPPVFNLSASRSFQMSQLFTSGGHSIGVSVSTSVLPMNTQDWSP